MNNIILSICIPTYKRDWCVKEQISRLKSCPAEICDKIEFIISDNCSPDNTQIIAENASFSNLKYRYFRNVQNLGMDGNFVQCFKQAKGKYIWLLGDDDYLNVQELPKLLGYLEAADYGLVHLAQSDNVSCIPFEEIADNKIYMQRVGYYITFISANIFNAESVRSANVNWEQYKGTLFSQIPMYIIPLYKSELNLLLRMPILDTYHDAVNNGGYNFFDTWANNYLYVWKSFVHLQIIPISFYRWIKCNIWPFIWSYTKRLLIKGEKTNFKVEGGWKILLKCYGTEWYFWWTLFKYPFVVIKRKFKKS